MHLVEPILLDRAVSRGTKATHVEVEIFAEGIHPADVLQRVGEVSQPLVFDKITIEDLDRCDARTKAGSGSRSAPSTHEHGVA